MPDINTMKESRFLKKEDCGNGILLTIRSCEQINVAKDGAPEELKWCLNFEETEKPYVTNVTTRAVIAAFTGRPNTDNWGGAKIVLFNDPTVFFNGKTGGIRARAPRNQPAGKPAPSAPPSAAINAAPDGPPGEDVPF